MFSSRPRTPETPWQRRFKWSLRLFAAIVVGAFGLGVFLGRAYWNDFEARHEALKERVRTRAHQGLRIPLLGVAEAGDAAEEYRAVLKELRLQWSPEYYGMLDNPARYPPEARQELLARFSPLLQRLRRAARLESACIPREALPAGTSFYDGIGAGRAGTLLTLSARLRQEQGDSDGAIEDIATCLQLAWDISLEPDSYSCYQLWRWGTEEARRILPDVETSSNQLAKLEQVLTQVEVGLVSAHSRLEEFITSAGDSIRRDVGASWKHQAGQGLFLQSLTDSYERAERALWMAAGEDWTKASARYQELIGQERLAWNPWKDCMALGANRYDNLYRVLLAQFRLVRAAARARLGKGPGTPGWPIDPMTLQPIDHQVQGDKIRISITRPKLEVVVPLPP